MNPSSTFVAADGDGYELVMGRWSRRLAKPFLDFAGSFSGEQILDVGCGTGSLASALTRRFPAADVRAVDFSPVYIDYARRTAPDPRITFEVGDACALRFASHTFDQVLALLLLHFVPSPDRAIAEMLRVAKPGATVAAAVWDVRGGYVANRMFFDTAAALDSRPASAGPATTPGQ